MANFELDPVFVKALKLLHSRSKDSAQQLKQMMFEAIAQKRSGYKEESSKSPNRSKSTIAKGLDNETKKREAEKRNFDKLKQDIAELNQTTQDPPKKPKLETKTASTDSKRETKEKPPVFREIDIFSSIREAKPVKERLKVIKREEVVEEKPVKKIEKYHENSDTESDTSTSDTPGGMDADDFAVDMGIACVVCRQFDVTSGNQLVECQECHSLYHQECHKPPVVDQDVNDPRFVWYCCKCQKNLKKMVTSKPQKPSKPSQLTISTPPVSSSAATFSFLSKSQTSKPTSDSSTLQPFKRMDPVKPSSTRESPTGSGTRPIGLAGLAANLSGKSLDSGRSKTSNDTGKTSKDQTKMSKSSSAGDIFAKSTKPGSSSMSSIKSTGNMLAQRSTFLAGADNVTDRKNKKKLSSKDKRK